MLSTSRAARFFIGFIILCGLSALSYGALQIHQTQVSVLVNQADRLNHCHCDSYARLCFCPAELHFPRMQDFVSPPKEFLNEEVLEDAR
jgi:hypothetical protein